MLTHRGTVRLETDRLILRPYRETDARPMFMRWASDPEVTRYLTWKPHRDEHETEDLLAAWCALYEDPAIYNWAIELRALGEAIGSISVVDRSERHENCEVGYCLSRSFWGQGLMTEALGAVIRFLLLDVGYHRVAARHRAENTASGRVMLKCGMRYEGTQRGAFRTESGGFSDVCFYAVTREAADSKGENGHDPGT